ncbi:MAG: O-methyltransferase [Acidobacteriaceae bacterium]
MLNERHRAEIARLWARKMEQDNADVPFSERHRNLAPASAEFLSALVSGIGAKKIVEIGGSSGISTIVLAAAAQQTQGIVISLEIEPIRQAESKQTIARLGLSEFVDFRLGDAAHALPQLSDLEFVLIDCEKRDYIRFFDMLQMHPGGIVVADNILSHHLTEYVAHVRSRAGTNSVTLPIGQGLELTRVAE